MSHSKTKKRGKSYFMDKKYAFVKKYIVGCILCGKQGYSPKILSPDFDDVLAHNRITKTELLENFDCLELDNSGVCHECGKKNALD